MNQPSLLTDDSLKAASATQGGLGPALNQTAVPHPACPIAFGHAPGQTRTHGDLCCQAGVLVWPR
jgi:hypothetical protein